MIVWTNSHKKKKSPLTYLYTSIELPWWLSGKESNVGSIPGWGRYPGEGNNQLQYSFLGNPTDRGAWQATVHGVTKGSDMTYWVKQYICISISVYPISSVSLEKHIDIYIYALVCLLHLFPLLDLPLLSPAHILLLQAVFPDCHNWHQSPVSEFILGVGVRTSFFINSKWMIPDFLH